jgi:hypothetical protein
MLAGVLAAAHLLVSCPVVPLAAWCSQWMAAHKLQMQAARKKAITMDKVVTTLLVWLWF